MNTRCANGRVWGCDNPRTQTSYAGDPYCDSCSRRLALGYLGLGLVLVLLVVVVALTVVLKQS